MYPKEILLQQQIPQLPKQRKDAIYRAENVAYILKSRLAMSGRLLIVAFYSRKSAANGFSLPSVTLFQTKKEYVTMINAPEGQKWKNCRLPHALGFDHDSDYQVIGITERDETRIRSFLHFQHDADYPRSIHKHIEGYQDTILKTLRIARKQRVASEIDKRMDDAPPLPDAFTRWIDREPLLCSRYIYYRRVAKRKAEGFCTHCKTDFIITEEIPVHNGKSVCPSCKSAITYKAIGKSIDVSDKSHAVILQKSRNSGEFILRYFDVTRSYYNRYRNPLDSQYEKARLFFRSDGTITGKYKYCWSSKTDRHDWHPSKDVVTGKNNEITWRIQYGAYQYSDNVWFRAASLYPYNLHSMLTDLNLSYDMKKNIAGRKVDVTTYLTRSMIYPFAPSLWRIGLSKLSRDLLEECYEPSVYQPDGALHMRFGASKAFIGFMREHNLGMEAVNLRTSLCDEPNGDDFLWLLENKLGSKTVEEVIGFTTPHRMKTYLEKQTKSCDINYYSSKSKADKVLGLWKDYISMCQTLGYDLTKKSVLYPKSIHHEHDKVEQLVEIQYDPETDEKIKDIYPTLDQIYSYHDNEFIIRPPKDFDDFINEGVNLLHCVCSNGYYRGHVEHTSYIFFLRRVTNPDSPYYTIEYEPETNKILQCYGYRHKTQNTEIREFTDRWLVRLTSKSTVLKAA